MIVKLLDGLVGRDPELVSGRAFPAAGLAAACTAGLAYGNAVALADLPLPAYVVVNGSAGLATLALARRAGLTTRQLGLPPHGVRGGLAAGAALSAAVLGLIAVARFAAPSLFERFGSDEVAGWSSGTLLTETLVRVPFGTALVEEAMFRGALLAALARGRTERAAALWSGLVFGLWHVGAALAGLERPRVPVALGAVAGQVAFTAASGLLLFAPLRVRSRSIAGPALVHAAVNSGVLAATWLVLRGG